MRFCQKKTEGTNTFLHLFNQLIYKRTSETENISRRSCKSGKSTINLKCPFIFCEGIYKEEVRERLCDPLATGKIQGAKSCRVKFIFRKYKFLTSWTNSFSNNLSF